MRALSQSWRRAKRNSYSSASAAFKRNFRRAAFFIETGDTGTQDMFVRTARDHKPANYSERFGIMSEITAAAVKQLREKTGAGMMECKNALVEAQGNEDKAVDILRTRGLASAKKREGRIAAEGIVG